MTPARRGDLALVLGGWLVVAAVAAAWLAIDRRPPEWDHANHLERAVLCARDLASADWRAIIDRSSFYPPIVPCLAGLAYLLAPSDAVAAQAVILLFLGVGMVATYAIGCRVADSTAGVAAAWIFGTAPFVLFSALRFQLDLPLAALVAVAVVMLLRTEGLTRTPACLATGIVFGLGMLVKPPFAVYLAGPVAWLLLRQRDRRAVRNALLCALAAAMVSLPWYGPRLVGLPMQIANRAVKNAALEGKPEVFTSTALSFYPSWGVTQFGVLAVMLLVIGLVVAAVRTRGFVLVAFVVPFVLFLLVRNKDLRYTLPLLPMAAVLAGMAVAAAGSGARRAGLAVIAAAGAVQLAGVMAGVPSVPTLPGIRVPWVLASPPSRADWHHRDVLALIARHRGASPVTVSVVPNDNFFSVSNFRYYAVRDGVPLRLTRAWDGEPIGIDYMVLKTGDQGPDYTEAKSLRVVDRLAQDAALARVFPVIGEFTLPDGSMGSVRAREVPAGVSTSPDALAAALERAIRRRLDDVARDVDGLGIKLTYDPTLARGSVPRLEITAARATVGELRRRNAATLRLHHVRVVAEAVVVNPFSLEAEGRLDLLDVGRLRIERAEIAGDDLQAFLGGLRALARARVELRDGSLQFMIEQPGPDLSARVRLGSDPARPLALAFDDVRVGGVPVPSGLLTWVVRHYDPTPRLASRLPFPVEIGPVTVTERALRVGG